MSWTESAMELTARALIIKLGKLRPRDREGLTNQAGSMGRPVYRRWDGRPQRETLMQGCHPATSASDWGSGRSPHFELMVTSSWCGRWKALVGRWEAEGSGVCRGQRTESQGPARHC